MAHMSKPARSTFGEKQSEGSESVGRLRELTQRAKQGDEGAFEALYQRLGGGLQRFFLKRNGGNVDQANDLTQQTWVEFWLALARYDPDRAEPSTFLYAVGYKIWLRYLRRATRAPTVYPLDECAAAFLPDTFDIEDALEFSEMLDALRECLRAVDTPNSLTDEERYIVARHADEEPLRALADVLGIAPSAVFVRNRKAREKLARCLAQKGFSLE